MNHFSVFTILYLTAFLCEMAENWKHPGFAAAFLVIICAIAFTRITRLKFFIFLIASTAYILLFRFPEVANHVNFILLVNLTLIVGIAYSWLRPTWQDADFFEMIKPPLRLSMVLVYFFTGFHKFNQDFFHPQASCIDEFLSQFVWLLDRSRVLFVPTILILLAAGSLLYARLFGNPLRRFSGIVQSGIWVGIAIAAVFLGQLIGSTHDLIQARFPAPLILLVAGTVILWEIIGSLMLLFPKTQALMLAFSLAMHASFALIGFVDFSALAVALLFTFIPPAYLNVLDQRPSVRIGGVATVSRAHAYLSILLVGFFFGGIHHKIYPIYGPKILTALFISGMFFLVATIVFYWPILVRLCAANRLPWTGVPLLSSASTTAQSGQGHRALVLFSASIILLFGLSPYLGLRTAGTFSMFSNLKTEGEYSIHFLLGQNQLKLWGYQEDVVEVLEIDDETARLGHKYRPLKGYKLPVVEFRKLVHKWTEANYTVPIRFVHNGVEYASADIVNDPTWKTPNRTWETYLMDFRIIQPDGANQCRW